MRFSDHQEGTFLHLLLLFRHSMARVPVNGMISTDSGKKNVHSIAADLGEESSLSFFIKEEDTNKRVDTFIARQVKDMTRSRAQDLIRSGYVKVNQTSIKTSYRLRSGDQINLNIPPAIPWHLKPEPAF